jgi:hypothetical protein
MQPGFPRQPGLLNDPPPVNMIEGYLSKRAARDGMPKYSYPNIGGTPKTTVHSMRVMTSFLEARSGDGRKK